MGLLQQCAEYRTWKLLAAAKVNGFQPVLLLGLLHHRL